ncbi:MAG TPA: CHAT domain-containing protein [Thermoanaerobaculia bacterium]|nr:CHAT domain-containing protein [Thermoanaerobaculia bacterium]
MSLRFAAAIFLLLVSTAAAATPEETVRRFYEAYAAGDVARAASFWSDAEAAAFAARATRAARARCVVLHTVDVETIDAGDQQATVQAGVFWSRWSAKSAAAAERVRWIITLRREGTAWKFTAWETAEERLARAVAAAPPEQRHALLAGEPSLHGRRLVESLTREAIAQSNRSDLERAAQLNDLARSMAAEWSDAAADAAVLSTDSILLRVRGRNTTAEALQAAHQAAERAAQSGDTDVMARTLMRLGRAQLTAGDAAFADSFARVLALDAHVEDASILALAASQMSAYFDRLKPRESLRYAVLASRYADESNDPAAMINAALNLDANYRTRGDRELARRQAEKALALARRTGMVAVEAGMLEKLASSDLELGREDRYIERTDAALALLGPADDDTRAEILIARAEYWSDRSGFVLAECALAEAESIVARISKPETAWLLQSAFAQLRVRQGRHGEAATHIARLGGGWMPPLLHAHIHRGAGRREEERAALELAIDKVETQRGVVDDPRQLATFFREASAPYVQLVEHFVDAGDAAGAFAVAERLKARTLKDLLAEGERPVLDEEAARLNRRVVDLNRRLLLVQRDGGDATAIRAELRRARGELEESIARAARPRVRTADAGTPALTIPPETLVVEFVLGEERATALVAANRGGVTTHSAWTIDATVPALRKLVDEFVTAVEARDSRYRPAARRLYDLLLHPAFGPQGPRTKLCIIPDGILWKVPFHALLTPDGDHVLERVPVFYAPSLSVLTLNAKPPRPSPPTVLALGDPELDGAMRQEIYAVHRSADLGRLPDARREVLALRDFYGKRATIRTGPVASETALKEEAGQFDVIHFATHGLVDRASPLYSALLLAGSDDEDGLLEAREIVGMPLRASLVVLSACDTARGRIDGGEGVVGLSWAVLAAGAPRTIATHWRVSSAATARLMIAFHRKLSRRPAVSEVAECLRQAQLEMLQDAHFSHPYYWAAFIMIGRDD